MSKYEPLQKFLKGLDRDEEHELKFTELERELGFDLPRSARSYQAWWANQRNGRHVQANSWLDAGWHTAELDLKGEQVTFRPVAIPRSPKTSKVVTNDVHPLSIAQAKAGVALHFGISASQIEITVRA